MVLATLHDKLMSPSQEMQIGIKYGCRDGIEDGSWLPVMLGISEGSEDSLQKWLERRHHRWLDAWCCAQGRRRV
jgi:hypothetical protein